MPTTIAVVGLLALFAAAGCTSVTSSAVRTDGLATPAHAGAVRVYAAVAPAEAREIGVVEVSGAGEEANIEALMPVFVRRVASIGGSGGLVDAVETRFEVRTELRQESFAYPCGFRGTCWGTRLMPYSYPVRVLTIRGRALLPTEGRSP